MLVQKILWSVQILLIVIEFVIVFDFGFSRGEILSVRLSYSDDAEIAPHEIADPTSL